MMRDQLNTWLDCTLPASYLTGAPAAAEAEWSRDASEVYCHRCGASSAPEGVTEQGCAACVGKPVAWARVVRVGAYREPLSDWIVDLKFSHQWLWADYLAGQLAMNVREQAPDVLGDAVVTHTPLHWRRRIARGFDQSLLIAERVAGDLDLPLARLLKRTRSTQMQTRLSMADRHRNMRGAFEVRSDDHNIEGKTVLLVDDVKTTGATAGQCARLLKKAGAARVILAVIAVANPKAHEHASE